MNFFKTNQKILLNITNINQLSFFLSVSCKILVCGQVKFNQVSWTLKKKFEFIKFNKISDLPGLDFLVSFNLSLFRKKTILKIFKHSRSIQGIFLFSRNFGQESIANFHKISKKTPIDLYFKIFFKVLNRKKLKNNQKQRQNLKLVKIIPRSLFPELQISRWDRILNLVFCRKKKSLKGIPKVMISSFLKNKLYSDQTRKGKGSQFLDSFQRGLEENGLLVTKPKFWNSKDFLFFSFFLS